MVFYQFALIAEEKVEPPAWGDVIMGIFLAIPAQEASFSANLVHLAKVFAQIVMVMVK